MKQTLFALSALIPFVVCGCSHDDAAHQHDFQPKHGGTLVELDAHGHGPMIEILHDEKAGVVTMHVMTHGQQPQSLAKAPTLQLPAAKKEVQGAGKDALWTFTDEALKAHLELMRFKLEIGDKSFAPEWKHSH